MTTGLSTFDGFSWASLLQGRPILVIDRESARGRATAEALEEAGAIATLAPGQAVGCERLAGQTFRHVLLCLSEGEALAERLAVRLAEAGRGSVLIANPLRHEALRAALPAARLADPALDARSLVLFLTETPDE